MAFSDSKRLGSGRTYCSAVGVGVDKSGEGLQIFAQRAHKQRAVLRNQRKATSEHVQAYIADIVSIDGEVEIRVARRREQPEAVPVVCGCQTACKTKAL